MNDPVLKLAMAKLLPEKIYIFTEFAVKFYWQDNNDGIREGEWLYVMQLVEEMLSVEQQKRYIEYIWQQVAHYAVEEEMYSADACFLLAHATFNQRATAMIKVKQIAAVEVPPTTAANQSSTIPYGEKE